VRCRLLLPMWAVSVRQSVCLSVTNAPNNSGPARWTRLDSASVYGVIRCSLCQITLASCLLSGAVICVKYTVVGLYRNSPLVPVPVPAEIRLRPKFWRIFGFSQILKKLPRYRTSKSTSIDISEVKFKTDYGPLKGTNALTVNWAVVELFYVRPRCEHCVSC